MITYTIDELKTLERMFLEAMKREPFASFDWDDLCAEIKSLFREGYDVDNKRWTPVLRSDRLYTHLNEDPFRREPLGAYGSLRGWTALPRWGRRGMPTRRKIRQVMYRTPMEDLPLYTTDPMLGVIARWRFTLGR